MSDPAKSDLAPPIPRYDPANPEYTVILTITPFDHKVQTVEDRFLIFDEKDVNEERKALNERYEYGKAKMMKALKKPVDKKDVRKTAENRERVYKQQLEEMNNKLAVRKDHEHRRQDYLEYIAETALNIDPDIREVFVKVIKDGEKWCASAWKGDKEAKGMMLATTKISENRFCESVLDALYQLWLFLQSKLEIPMHENLRLTIPQINALRAFLKGVV